MDNITISYRIVVTPDQDADTSYLEQEGFEDRLAEWRRGDFGYVGVYVEIERHNGDTGVTSTARSGGLWGIESDSGEDYFREVAKDELSALRAEGYDVDDIALPIVYR